MRKIALLALAFLGVFGKSFAQKIEIKEPPVVAQMVERWAELNRSNATVEGWRVQLFSTTERAKAEAAKSEFLQKFPDSSADWAQEKPYYKLRAGAFSTKLEAMRLVEDLRFDYPGAYPARDSKIPVRDFLDVKN